MYFKKINILLSIITIINCLLLFKNFSKTSYSSQYCLISDSNLVHSHSLHNQNYLAGLKASLKYEVIDLEKQRENLLSEISIKTAQLNQINNEIYHSSIKSFRIKHSIISLQQIRKDFERRHKDTVVIEPIITRFNYSSSKIDYTIDSNHKPVHISANGCTMNTCVDHHRCHSFTISLAIGTTNQSFLWSNAVQNSPYYLHNNSACITIILANTTISSIDICKGNNCALLVLTDSLAIPHQQSIIIGSNFTRSTYRPKYDIVISSTATHRKVIDRQLPMLFPTNRRYLLSFTASIDTHQLPKLDSFVIDYLLNISDEIQTESGENKVNIDVNCLPTVSTGNRIWDLCDHSSSNDRVSRLIKSKFCLILSPVDPNILTTAVDQQRLLECLLAASIPVIMGDLLLPFEEVIDWSSVIIRLPKQRIIDLLPTLNRLSDSDCAQMKRNGRDVLNTFLLTPQQQVDSIARIFTARLNLPVAMSRSFPAKLFYRSSADKSIRYYNFTLPTFQIEIDPYLGPIDVPEMASANHLGGADFAVKGGRHLIGDFYRYPSTPWRQQLAADAALRGHLARGYVAINHTVNEAGTEFMHSLGGNFIYEQFTIVMLSYKRLNLLLKSLELLNDLPYLHSIIVVWNDPKSPPANLRWPKLHVQIKVVNAPGNSLNNRFLPYDIIETDAILSFDDDMQLRHDEIIFAFRVWRENRDRIVGFISRYHSEYPGPAKLRYAGNQWWMYNANYTCEYSMILTGAAFLHRFYLYAYSNDMSPRIRQIIDKHHNCEDIAMNFLVSHITRMPPIKVTVRWTLSCINCEAAAAVSSADEALHNRAGHYTVRSACINEFATVYGYNPLLYSQYRADSVLFKTRLPSDKQKCYRYI